MAARASWTGYLRLSLVNIPVRLYTATSSAGKIAFHQLHKGCHQRLRQQLICPEHGPVDRADVVKGYEYEKDKYVVLEESDLEKVRLETTKSIELLQFVNRDEVDPIYLSTPYYVAPDGSMAEESFRVIREAMRKSGKTGLGRVIMHNKEQIVAINAQDKGMRMTMLRHASEIRAAEPYFEEIKNGDVDSGQLKLAIQLVESSSAPFDPEAFTDRYREGLLEIVKAKMEGHELVEVQQSEAGKVINLMDALEQSLARSGVKKPGRKPPARSVAARGTARTKKKRKAG